MSFQNIHRASLHPIICEKPAVNFFEGALLGNGGLGVDVTTRPDSIVLHFGHNNVWDIRVAENHKDEIGTFAEIFAKVKAISPDLDALDDDPWYRQYITMTSENYNAPYPRPFPCGSLILGFDRRKAELIGHHLDISCGLLEVRFYLQESNNEVRLQLFSEMDRDRVWLRMIDSAGNPTSAPFERVRLYPDPGSPKDIPPFTILPNLFEDTIAFSQLLPFTTPGIICAATEHPKDRIFRLALRVNANTGTWQPQTSYGIPRPVDSLERALLDATNFIACVELEEGLAAEMKHSHVNQSKPTAQEWQGAFEHTRSSWETYWDRSAVALDDQFLERIWYWNLYFFNCSVKPESMCPGLFANWSLSNIGTAWHGDYHMNYNTQQPFWLAFASNHVDKHLAYINLVESLMPISRKWAHEYYGLDGAYFPHSAYPVEMNMMPYPVPHWGWEVCETPWTVQSLWWHYLYSLDIEYLRDRAFEPIKAAVQFLASYMLRPDACWDGKPHIFPTVSPELYGLTPGLKKNYDCLADLTLTKFIFHAYLQAVAVLNLQTDEDKLCDSVRLILDAFPVYPTHQSTGGPVFVSVPGENPEIVYNVPMSLMAVFPGEEYGLHSRPEEFAIAANTYRQQRNEGGNDLVFLNMQAARLGLLDLERFKRQINYCLLPNGICQDMVLQVHGRYSDETPYDFMRPMGIWFENVALPAVINECLLQSYTGTLHLFPNWPLTVAAEFQTLRAVGGFLVSAACSAGNVQWIRVISEAGAKLTLASPWQLGEIITRETQPGEVIYLTRDGIL